MRTWLLVIVAMTSNFLLSFLILLILLSVDYLPEGIRPSGQMPCSRQYSSQQVPPIWQPACPIWTEMHSLWNWGSWACSRVYKIDIGEPATESNQCIWNAKKNHKCGRSGTYHGFITSNSPQQQQQQLHTVYRATSLSMDHRCLSLNGIVIGCVVSHLEVAMWATLSGDAWAIISSVEVGHKMGNCEICFYKSVRVALDEYERLFKTLICN